MRDALKIRFEASDPGGCKLPIAADLTAADEPVLFRAERGRRAMSGGNRIRAKDIYDVKRTGRADRIDIGTAPVIARVQTSVAAGPM